MNNLYLQEFNGSNQNPICKEADYWVKVLKTLIRLWSLDGIRKGFAQIEYDYDDGGIEKPSFK